MRRHQRILQVFKALIVWGVSEKFNERKVNEKHEEKKIKRKSTDSNNKEKPEVGWEVEREGKKKGGGMGRRADDED